ncbi:MAG: DUF4185 domain-containing protein [Planctomycetes bacterium]|nr:DUF4185 domain-containing protein [Planctomycetota bacterium]
MTLNSDMVFEWTGPRITYPRVHPEDKPEEWGPPNRYFDDVPTVRGDTYPMTWADDDEIYTSSGDPSWGGKNDGLDVEKFSGQAPDYRITRVNPMTEYTGIGGKGPKPSGMICVDGVLYLAFQNILGQKPPAHGEKSQHGSDAQVTASRDHGRTWTPAPGGIREPMFPGNTFGGPAFVNFGRDNGGARDDFVYAVSGDQWDNGSDLRAGRVHREKILEREAWEFVCGAGKDGSAEWTRDIEKATPVFRLERKLGLPEMVYIRETGRYLLLTWHLYGDFDSDAGTELFIFEAPEPWGPFKMLYHEEMWEGKEVNPYCPRIPLKWVRRVEGGVAGWLQFSGSWRQKSPYYRSHIRPFLVTARRS